MNNESITEAAIERNRTWIEAVETSVQATVDEATVRQVMKSAGTCCARQTLSECATLLGRQPQTVDELLDATNKRRARQLSLNSLWTRDGNKAHLKIDTCGCTLVKAGLAAPNPVHCLCTAGMFETLFASVCENVRVDVIKTIGAGDTSCEFTVHFEE